MKNNELTLDAVREALSFIPADDRDIWVKMAMALKDEYGDEAKDAWLDWSSTALNYNASSADHVWKSVSSGKVTIASLIYEAKQFGWKPRASHQRRVTPEEYARKQAERERRRAEEVAEERAKAERAAKRAADMWEKAEPAADHPYLARKGIQPHGTRLLPIWERRHTDTETGEVTTVSVLNVLLVPIYSGPKAIASLQAIFAATDPTLDRDKDYLPGGHKQGCYYTIGAITRSTLRVIFCEGFATGASIHEATGCPVVVCFDAGNLQPVAEAVRAKLPDVEIIIAGDNDLWTKNNPGARKANAAAWAVQGRVALPIFEDYTSEPTDFNDLRDADAIRAQVDQAVSPQDPEHYTPECRWVPPDQPASPQPEVGNNEVDAASQNAGSGSPGQSFPGAEPAVQDSPPGQAAPTAPGGAHDDDDDHDASGYFTIKGYDHDRYFVFQHERKQLAVYTAGSFTDSGFIALAPLQFWEIEFPADSGFNKRAALNWFIRLAHRRGIFDPSHTRGRGAWVDRGRIVLHLGNELVVDGEVTPITKFESRYVYELDRSLPPLSASALGSDEGEELLELAGLFRWTKPASAPMLAGWCALAPLCGALRWRPHIWLTGGAGCGKSSILNGFVHVLMNGMDIFAQGNSTEAGIRQTLRQDALPVLFDESETNNDREKMRVDGVLAMIRQASTESAARTLKGSASGDAMAFHIRSMFCLASIMVGMEKQADYERLAVLALRPKHDNPTAAAESWERIKNRLYDLGRDEDLPARLFRRSLNLLPITLKNIEVFASAGAKKFGSQRDGDQYGTLMAGAWSLISDRVASEDEAMEMLNRYEWNEHMEYADADESMRALHAVMEARIRLQGGQELAVHEIVELAKNRIVEGVEISASLADTILQRYGMRVRDDYLLFSNSSTALRGLVHGSSFESDLRGHLLRVPGASRFDNRPVKIGPAVSKCVAIPLNLIIHDDPIMGDDDRPF